MTYKLGSLFDGSGGFPLAGSLCGVEPMWAAEVEPYPIAVTRSRFPHMRHLGDISRVCGAEIAPVDIITFGSPCQDLSVAGKRAGLKHEANGDEETTRSGLFMEAVRIIREMREATNGEYPTFALWENVPGAFSSNNGEDFRLVCEELIKIVEPKAVMPAVPQGGWAYADSYCGDGWSLAYRVFDAQYWGVPQRRRRIHLVVDFRGGRAREVLFEREGVRGYFAEGRTPWQSPAPYAQGGSRADDRAGESAATGDRGLDAVAYTLKVRSGVAIDSNGKSAGKGALVQTEKAATLATTNDQYLFQPMAYSFDSLASNSMKSSNPNSGCRQVEVAKTLDTTDPNPSKNQGGIAIVEAVAFTQPTIIVDSVGGQAERSWETETAPCLKATHYKCPPLIAVPSAGFCTEPSAKAYGVGFQEETAPTLRAGVTPAVVYAVENHPADSRVDIDESGKVQTLTSRMGTGGGNVPMVMEPLPIHDMATRFSGKRGDKTDGKGNGLGIGEAQDPEYTLTAGDRHAVAYATDIGFFSSYAEQSPTLLARGYKDPHLVTYPKDAVHYIVRRLTPTECARLQGFADRWGDIDEKDSLTPEEYEFWLGVRNTHATINGKKVQEYTEKQILTWYNKLHTDSAEYKMWGNGIALPPALYCVQGLVDALEHDTDWLL